MNEITDYVMYQLLNDTDDIKDIEELYEDLIA